MHLNVYILSISMHMHGVTSSGGARNLSFGVHIYIYKFFFFGMKCKIIMCNFFWAFSFCLKGPNKLLSGPNYRPKFNFIGHKKP